jgi:hypothetical protein
MMTIGSATVGTTSAGPAQGEPPWVILLTVLVAVFISAVMGAWVGSVHWKEHPEVGYFGAYRVMVAWAVRWAIWGGLVAVPLQVWGAVGWPASLVVIALGWWMRGFLCPKWPGHLWKPPPSLAE